MAAGPASRKVGLRPERGWARRNFEYLSHSLFPALIRKRISNQPSVAPTWDSLNFGEIEVTWIGHASFLVRTPGFNALIDPVWAKWMGPLKRQREPGLSLSQLPQIDLILITHAHFDHLWRPTLRRICDGSQTLIVPRGVAPIVKRLDHAEVIELTDWESIPYRDSRIHFTPAHHWGARFVADTHRGFGGFLLESPGHRLYHSGDTAYFDGFSAIGDRHDIDTAILPIGAYDCPSGREVHMNPEEAIQAFFDLGANRFIPMHHATFPISNEAQHEPLDRLHRAVNTHGLHSSLIAPTEGELVKIAS